MATAVSVFTTPITPSSRQSTGSSDASTSGHSPRAATATLAKLRRSPSPSIRWPSTSEYTCAIQKTNVVARTPATSSADLTLSSCERAVITAITRMVP